MRVKISAKKIAMQLQMEICKIYKTYWHILKQIRIAMGNENFEKTFGLISEVGETYVGSNVYVSVVSDCSK